MSNKTLEINRKIFHVSGMILPIIYLFTSKLIALIGIVALTLTVIYIDTYRHKNTKVQYLADNFLKFFMRDTEKQEGVLSGASWMFIGLTLTCILYDKDVTIFSWSVLFICDALAALVGIKFGKNIIISGKTFEGAFAFFFSSIFLGIYYNFYISSSFGFIALLIGSIFSTLVEIYSKKYYMDDNLLIPITMGFFLAIF